MKFRIITAICSMLCCGFYLTAQPATGAELTASLKEVTSGLVSPIELTTIGKEGEMLVADQIGVIYRINKNGQREEKAFLDLRSKLCKLNQGFDERGVLGLALHPKFEENKRLFVVYSAPLRKDGPAEWDHTMTLSEFKADDSGTAADISTEKVMLQIDKPYFNHNGGCLMFGPDEFLYLSVGDGGNANGTGKGHSEKGNSQDLTTLLGKIVRLDVRKSTGISPELQKRYGIPSVSNPVEPGYYIPADNPFLNIEGARPEIYALGLRNVWKMSFDRDGTHGLLAADIGQDLYEEVNIIKKGGNYGWNLREGFHCFDPKNPKKSPETCAEKDEHGHSFVDPVFEYKSFRSFPKDPDALGISITSGYMYRGKAIPELRGKYIFADWSRHWVKPDGMIYVATPSDGKTPWKIEKLSLASHEKGLNLYVTAFGQDQDGELYVLTSGSNGLVGTKGIVFKLVSK
ncbi:MAG: PQQ-dependent sugar dehydrogenase [Verrucomicrobiota bacterium]|nr:PQQ-dependent sugar dehydrogenase [Verrucomicrobiota bacterium]